MGPVQGHQCPYDAPSVAEHFRKTGTVNLNPADVLLFRDSLRPIVLCFQGKCGPICPEFWSTRRYASQSSRRSLPLAQPPNSWSLAHHHEFAVLVQSIAPVEPPPAVGAGQSEHSQLLIRVFHRVGQESPAVLAESLDLFAVGCLRVLRPRIPLISLDSLLFGIPPMA